MKNLKTTMNRWATLVMAASIGVWLTGCATSEYVGIGYEAGTHEFPEDTAPWFESRHPRLLDQGFELVQGAFTTPGVFSEAVEDWEPDKSPYTYVGLENQGSYMVLTINEVESSVTVSSYIHATGGSRKRDAASATQRGRV